MAQISSNAVGEDVEVEKRENVGEAAAEEDGHHLSVVLLLRLLLLLLLPLTEGGVLASARKIRLPFDCEREKTTSNHEPASSGFSHRFPPSRRRTNSLNSL